MQVIYLADADPLTGIHPGHIDPAISAAEVIHGTAVFHQDRTEGKGVQHAFSVDMCRDRSFLGLVDAGEIAIFINQEYVHEQCVPLADGFQIVFVQGPLADDVSQTAFFSAAEVVAVDGEYGIGAFRQPDGVHLACRFKRTVQAGRKGAELGSVLQEDIGRPVFTFLINAVVNGDGDGGIGIGIMTGIAGGFRSTAGGIINGKQVAFIGEILRNQQFQRLFRFLDDNIFRWPAVFEGNILGPRMEMVFTKVFQDHFIMGISCALCDHTPAAEGGIMGGIDDGVREGCFDRVHIITDGNGIGLPAGIHPEPLQIGKLQHRAQILDPVEAQIQIHQVIQPFQRGDIQDSVLEQFQIFQMLQRSNGSDIFNRVAGYDQDPEVGQIIQKVQIGDVVMAYIQCHEVPAVFQYGKILTVVLCTGVVM